MGSSSKVILVGATSLVVGVYAISLKKAQADGIDAALQHVKRMQHERVEDAAMRTALSTFVKDKGGKDKSGKQKALDGSTFTYTITTHGTYADISLTVMRDGEPQVITARLDKLTGNPNQGARKIHRGKWEISKSYVQR